jgi:hypothetical protein
LATAFGIPLGGNEPAQQVVTSGGVNLFTLGRMSITRK